MTTHGFRQGNVRTVGHGCRTSILVQMLAVTIAYLISSSAVAQSKGLELSHMGDLVGLSEPQISPRGKQIVFVVSRPNFVDNRYENELVLLDIKTGSMRVLTYDRPNVRHPRWSPSGDQIGFLDTQKKTSQLFVVSMAGGEAHRITDAARDVTLFAWRPDGRALAYVTEDKPKDRTGDEKHNKSFVVGNNGYLETSAPMPSHIWLVSAEGDTLQRLTSGIDGVLKRSETIGWSPDGKLLAFSTQPKPHTGEIARGSLKVLDVGSGAIRTLVPGPTMVTAPSFSPSGAYISYSRPLGPAPMWYPHGIHISPVSGGEETCVTEDIDRTFYTSRWLAEEEAILVGGPDHTRMSFWVQPINGPPYRLKMGSVNPVMGSVDRDGAIAFIGSEPRHPDELYYMATKDAPPQRLTSFNDPIASLLSGKVESITWHGPDGFEEDGVLVYPPDFNEKKKYPLVFFIHGGPMDASTEAFDFSRELLAAQGWIVFCPNYRGSVNRGRAYQTAVINDAGNGPGRDIMAGLAAVKAKGIVDDNRIAVAGWSYGGYMTTWLISHYQGWAAAVAGAAVTDYIDSYNLSDVNVNFGPGFNYSPWVKDWDSVWREQSPITYARNISTHTLLLSNTGDQRVPITQSYKMYHALKENGVKAQFIAYPIPGHFPGDPVHVRDVYRRRINWIAQHFGESL